MNRKEDATTELERSQPTTPSQGVQRWTLIAMILATGIIFLDSTVVNVALPTIDRELGAGLSGLQWIVDGYVLTLAALLILGGSLGDRYGRRRMMIIGLIGFGLSSAACGLAPSISWLIAARLLQGITGALLVPGSLALLRATFPEGEARGQAIGQWSGWSGITTVLGPLLGGWLVGALSWRWIFFINLPIVAVTVILLLCRVPESRSTAAPQRLDWLGAALVTIGLGSLAYGLIEGPVVGWTAPTVVVALAGGPLALLFFVLQELRTREPMVPLGLFRSRDFSGANLTTLSVYFALYGMTFFLVIYLQNVLGYSALVAGLILAPVSLLMLLLSPRFGRLAGRHGPRLFMTTGPIACGLGLLLFAALGPGGSFWTGLLPAIVVFGLGLATTVAPLTDTVVSSVPEEHSGVAAAVNNSVSRVAALIAVASLGVVVTTTFRAALTQQTADLSLAPNVQAVLQEAAQDPTGSVDRAQLPQKARDAINVAYTEAFQRAMLTGAAAAFLGGAIAWLSIRRSPADRGDDARQESDGGRG